MWEQFADESFIKYSYNLSNKVFHAGYYRSRSFQTKILNGLMLVQLQKSCYILLLKASSFDWRYIFYNYTVTAQQQEIGGFRGSDCINQVTVASKVL